MHHVCWRTVRKSKIVFKTLWKRICTKYEAIRVPIEHYRLHQDNSPPHTTASTLLKLDVLGFGRVDHLQYSPYLAPFDFDVYPKVKSQLKGRRFSSRPELRLATANIISQYNQDWSRAIYWRILREKWQVSDWRSQFNKPTLLMSLKASQACSTYALMTVFKAPYDIGKWLHVYHCCSSSRMQIEMVCDCFTCVCFVVLTSIEPAKWVLCSSTHARKTFLVGVL